MTIIVNTVIIVLTAFKYIDAYDASGTIYTLYSFCIMGFLMCIHFNIKINSNLISNQASEIPDVIIHSHSEESNRISSTRRGNHVSCRRDSDNNNDDNEDGNSSAAVQSLNLPNLPYTPDCERRHYSRLFNVRWVSNPLYDSIQIIPHINSASQNSELVSPYAISEPLY